MSTDLASARDIGIGDVVPVSFGDPVDEVRAEPTTVVSPVGVEPLTVVGIAALPDEMLPDGLYPRGRVIVSPDVARRYDCRLSVPSPDAAAGEGFEQLLPKGCATNYRYYSLEIDKGDRGVKAALDAYLPEEHRAERRAAPA